MPPFSRLQALFNVILEIITVQVSNCGNFCICFFSTFIQYYMALGGNSTNLSIIPSPMPHEQFHLPAALSHNPKSMSEYSHRTAEFVGALCHRICISNIKMSFSVPTQTHILFTISIPALYQMHVS